MNIWMIRIMILQLSLGCYEGQGRTWMLRSWTSDTVQPQEQSNCCINWTVTVLLLKPSY